MMIGLFNQLILLPVIGFALIALFPVQPEIAVGLILLAACPGGPTSNLITHLAKGDTALSVSLTAVSSLVTVFTIPFIVNLGLLMAMGRETAFQLNVLQTIGQVFIIVIIPVSLGMLIKARKAAFADRMDRPVRIASALVFVLVIVGILVKERANIVSYFEQAGLLALALNLATMITGYYMASLFRLSRPQEVSISIESGIQNGTLAISIATVLLNNSAFAIAPAIYGLVMFFSGGAMIYWSGRRAPKTARTV
jgi:BASS family bile acid:Na+ symporter